MSTDVETGDAGRFEPSQAPGPATDKGRVQRLTEASEWLLRLDAGDCSEEEVAAWLRWCDASPENLRCFETLQQEWQMLDALKPAVQAQAVLASIAAPRQSWKRWRLAAAVIGVLVTAALAGYWAMQHQPVQQLAANQMNRAATLPDGSSIVLGAKTLVDVDFSGPRRHLNLSEGLAYFKVQHDASRPFVVDAGDVSVTAVGTAFDVRHEKDRVVVTVEEGVVEVSSHQTRSDGGAANTWRAEAGYRLSYSANGRTASLARVDPEALLKWRSGELAYVWEPLSAVVADINRYSTRQIVLRGERVGELRFTGTVFAASIDDWLRAVQSAYNLRASTGPNGEIVLEAR